MAHFFSRDAVEPEIGIMEFNTGPKAVERLCG
jgi:hypothetical protein